MTNSISTTTSSAYFDENISLATISSINGGDDSTFIETLENLPKNKTSEIVCFAVDPKLVSVIDEGNAISSHSKIQKQIKDLKNTWVIPREANFLPTLSHLQLVRELVDIILNSNDLDETVRTEQILLSMEKMDPSLSSINHEISIFLHTDDEVLRNKALNRLDAYCENSFRPLQFHFPMKPHVPKNPSFYTSLLPKIQQSSLQGKNQKNHDADWHIEEIYIGENASTAFENLKEIAVKEKILKVQKLSDCVLKPRFNWLRDVMIILDNQEIIVPSRINV